MKSALVLFHQTETSGVLCAEEKIQIRIPAGVPITPPARPVGPAEVAHALAQDFDRAGPILTSSRIEDKFRATR